MKKKEIVKLLVGLFCALILLLAIVLAVSLDRRSPDPASGILQPNPTDPSQSVTIPTGTVEVPTADVTTPTDEPPAPTDGTTIPTAPENTTDPTEATTVPAEDITTPTQSTISPTEGTATPTLRPTAPTEAPTSPTGGATTPTNGTIVPTVVPTHPSTTPTEAPTVPTGGTTPTTPHEEFPTQPEEIPPSVTIPTEKDPETGENAGITFPCQVPEYGLVLEKIAPYNGMFVEDGSNVSVENIAMLMVYNDGDSPVEYTRICIEYGEQTLEFDISALPVGQRLVVQEKTGKSIPDGEVTYAAATVVQRAEMEMSENQVLVTDNGNNTLTIQNLTDATIPTVRVFYKYYMEEEGIFVGGIAFTVRLTRLGAGASVTVQPSHYASKTCRVVMVLTYDSEV